MKRHGVVSLAGKMAAQMRRGHTVPVARTQGGSSEPTKIGLYLRTAITGPTGLSPIPVNGATDTWDASNENGISTAKFIKGANADVYRQALLNRGLPAADWVESASVTFPGKTNVAIKNKSVKHFISFFDQTDILHGFPPQYIQAIRAVSRVNTKIGFWFLSDRMFPGVLYSGWAEAVRQLQLPYLMVGSPQNISAGCTATTAVDPEQGDAWPGGTVYCPENPAPALSDTTGHAWFIDFTNASYASAIAAGLVGLHNTYWSLRGTSGTPDTWMSDNMLKQFVPDGAANAPAITDANWGAGVERIVSAIDAAFVPRGYGRMWGNVGDCSRVSAYSNLKGMFIEHGFNQATLAGSITAVNNMLPYLGQNSITAAISYRKGIYAAANDAMCETHSPPEWQTIYDRAVTVGATGRLMAGMWAAGTGSGDSDGYLFWQPQFRMPV